MRPKTAKPKSTLNDFQKEIQFLQQQKLIALGGDIANMPAIFTKSPAFLVLESELQAEIFNARCHDTAETVNIERVSIIKKQAKIFKEEFNKMNSKKFPETLNLYSMRLSTATIMALANQKPNYLNINIADNLIGDYAAHAIRTLLQNTQLRSLNLSSNMISHIGLGQIIEELCKNQYLKSLDLGILEGSIRKNSLGLEGAKLITQLILSNKVLETLKLQDNDLTQAGGEIIGTALKNNRVIKHLKVAENDLKAPGIETILEFGTSLESLDLSKNNIRPTHRLQIYLQSARNLKRLSLEYNQLSVKGTEYIASGLMKQQIYVFSNSLNYLNLRGNQIGDEGIQVLAQSLQESETLEELDIALNDITPQGVFYLAEAMMDSPLKILNLSRNLLGDESMVLLTNAQYIQKLDVSSSRVTDKGFLQFLEKIPDTFLSLRANDNYIAEKAEKTLLEILEKNMTLLNLQVSGNRLSLCCLNRIQKIILRNQKIQEEKEPNKIRTEIYKLKYEQKKIMQAKEKLQQQEREILQIEEQKHKVIAEIDRIKQQEQGKRQFFSDKIQEHQALIEQKKKILEDKQGDFERSRMQKQMEIDSLRAEFEVAFKRRKDLEEQFEKQQAELAEQEEKFKNEMTRLEESIAEKKRLTIETEEKNVRLREELAQLNIEQKEAIKQAEAQAAAALLQQEQQAQKKSPVKKKEGKKKGKK